MQEGSLSRSQGNILRFSGSEGHRDGSVPSFEFQAQDGLHWPAFPVAQSHADFQVGRSESLHIQVRDDIDILDGHGPRRVQGDGTDDAHALVQRPGIPVHETDVQVPFLRPAKLDFQFVIGFQKSGYIVGMTDENAGGRVGRSDLLSVQENIGIIAQAVEYKFRVLPMGRFAGKGGPVGPNLVEDALVHLLIVPPFQQVLAEKAIVIQGSRHCRGNRGGILLRGTLTGKRPT